MAKDDAAQATSTIFLVFSITQPDSNLNYQFQ